MFFENIKNLFFESSNERNKSEDLHHKCSQLKGQINKLGKEKEKDMNDYKLKIHETLALELVEIYENFEEAKNSSFKIRTTDKEIQRLLLDLNKAEKTLKDSLRKFSVEEVLPKEKFYDTDLHEVASYKEVDGVEKGQILKTIKKGFKYRGKTIKKPRVIVVQ